MCDARVTECEERLKSTTHTRLRPPQYTQDHDRGLALNKTPKLATASRAVSPPPRRPTRQRLAVSVNKTKIRLQRSPLPITLTQRNERQVEGTNMATNANCWGDGTEYDFNGLTAKLNQYLRLRTNPVAMKRFATEADLDAIP